MLMSEPAERIWTLCEEYIPLAMEHLSLANPYPDKPAENRLDMIREVLRINFLFPRIAPKGFDALVTLRWQQWMCRGAKQVEASQKSILAASGAEHREAFFNESKAIVESFMESLSPVQQEIVREKFFMIE